MPSQAPLYNEPVEVEQKSKGYLKPIFSNFLLTIFCNPLFK